MAFLVQHHDGHAGDGLAHRANSKYYNWKNRLSCLAVLHALSLKPCDLSSTNHKRHRTCDPFAVDAPLNCRTHSLQPLRRQTDRLRLDYLEVLREANRA